MAPVAVVRILLVSALCGILPRAVLGQTADPLEGLVVREIRVTGSQKMSAAEVERHLATRAGEPFRRANLALDERRLDELRLFTAVTLHPRLESGGMVLDVDVTETLRLLPIVAIRVTDENGVSGGPGMQGVNLMGRGTRFGLAVRFGGETGVSATLDKTTVTPGTWARHFGFDTTSRRNDLYDFDERSTAVDLRAARNWTRGLRTGVAANVMALDTGSSGESLSPDGEDIVPSVGLFVTRDTLDSSTSPRAGTWAEVEVDRLFGDASSWTFILDGRRFQRLSDRHGLGLFGLATLQTGDVGVGLPDYLQFDLGGANSVRGWSLGSRRGRNQFIGSVEYAYVVRPPTAFSLGGLNLYAGMQIVAFSDVGLAWNDGGDFEAASAIDGYGFGMRFMVPFVDLIRLELAWGEPGRGAAAYFGVSLKATRQRQRVR